MRLCLKQRMMRYNMVLVEIYISFLFLPFDLNGVYGKRLLLLHTTVQSDERDTQLSVLNAMNIIYYIIQNIN